MKNKAIYTLKVKGYEDISSPYKKVVERWRKNSFKRYPALIITKYI